MNLLPWLVGEDIEGTLNRSKIAVGSTDRPILHPGSALFLASFLALFLEFLLIRWVPSLVRVVAYYGNLMLISAFLGLGCGAMVAHRRLGLRKWFPPLLFFLVLFVAAAKGFNFQQGPDELRFHFTTGATTTTLPIVAIFVLNALLFVPLGDLIGSYFQRMAPLRAYSWDLGGAITGTALFGLFSYFWFSPILGFIITMVVYLLYCRGVSSLMMTGIFFTSSLAVVQLGTDNTAIWSPYNHISVLEIGANGQLKSVSAPAANIVDLRDPPFYAVLVNHAGYMWVGTIDGRRYTAPGQYQLKLGQHKIPLANIVELYTLPHLIRPGAKDVLVVGSGGGMDVEAALLYGAERVDAVEIDPVIIGLGHQYNPSQAYKDPRVSIHNTDARAFFRQATKGYDMVVFGFLDSHSLFSQMSNIRLDGYVHTVEGFREAFGLLREGGLMTVAFYYEGKTWLIDRLISMVRTATGTVPMIDVWPTGQVIILAGKEFVPHRPERFIGRGKTDWEPSGIPEATDDWPYLYLRKRFIPSDYLVSIGFLLAISLLFVFLTSGKTVTGIDLHFFFLGAGFLLLETKSITTISLYFGTSWFVSMILILGVLIMVLVANLVATKLRRFSLILYLPLVASIAFLFFYPTHNVLAWPFTSRLIYSLIVVPLPIFFAGLIFSSTFRESRDPTFSFGSNLLGAMIGGFVEYLGMITGTRALLLVVLVFYLASLLVRLRSFQIARAVV